MNDTYSKELAALVRHTPGLPLHEAAWEVQEQYDISDDAWLDYVMPHLTPDESYCEGCEEHTLHLDSHCWHCGTAPNIHIRNL